MNVNICAHRGVDRLVRATNRRHDSTWRETNARTCLPWFAEATVRKPGWKFRAIVANCIMSHWSSFAGNPREGFSVKLVVTRPFSLAEVCARPRKEPSIQRIVAQAEHFARQINWIRRIDGRREARDNDTRLDDLDNLLSIYPWNRVDHTVIRDGRRARCEESC